MRGPRLPVTRTARWTGQGRTRQIPRTSSVSGSVLEGLDEILTVIGLGRPLELRRSLASTNIIASVNSSIRQVCRHVKRRRDARMALRWTATGMFEARKGLPPASRPAGSSPFPGRLSSSTAKSASLTGSRAPHNLPSGGVARASFNIKRDIPRIPTMWDCGLWREGNSV